MFFWLLTGSPQILLRDEPTLVFPTKVKVFYGGHAMTGTSGALTVQDYAMWGSWE